MRQLLAAALLFGFVALAGPATAQEPKAKPAPTLKAGDPAPAIKATKWLQGAEVKEFAPGKVYVVEFWATWCGPCIVMMPHLGDLQREYKNKGVTFIGYSAKDPSNTQERVTAFVEKRGPKLGYTMCYADDRETYAAWMTAAGRGGIPCSFVVDQGGRIAWIGHPMYLDVVLPKVVSGTWKVEGDGAIVARIEEEVTTVFKSFSKGPEEALKTVADFEKAHPELAHIPYFTGPKLNAMLKAKKTDEAKKFAEEVLARAIKQDDPLPPNTVALALRTQGKDDKELLSVALKASEAGLKIAGDKDARAILGVAEAHFALGDKAKAKEFGAKAIAAAETEPAATKTFIANAVKKFEEGDK
jgi:thiol-disulfide isomerase/thioredoxin